MKNKKLIIISSTGGILFLIILMVVLIILGIIPNPFLDTSDLICRREEYSSEFGMTSIEEYIYSFDNKAREKKVIERYIDKYDKEEMAKEVYNQLLEMGFKSKKLEGNTILEEFEITNLDSRKTRKELKSFYERQYGYICE